MDYDDIRIELDNSYKKCLCRFMEALNYSELDEIRGVRSPLLGFEDLLSEFSNWSYRLGSKEMEDLCTDT